MNTVTINAKARLAAQLIYSKGFLHFASLSEESNLNTLTSLIKQIFIPDSASEANKDLIEALKALKFCKDVMRTCIIPLSDKMPLISKCIYDADKILAKYPNLTQTKA